MFRLSAIFRLYVYIMAKLKPERHLTENEDFHIENKKRR